GAVLRSPGFPAAGGSRPPGDDEYPQPGFERRIGGAGSGADLPLQGSPADSRLPRETTRRKSHERRGERARSPARPTGPTGTAPDRDLFGSQAFALIARRRGANGPCCVSSRSEEHTSELQSRENLVCRLLLEKK